MSDPKSTVPASPTPLKDGPKSGQKDGGASTRCGFIAIIGSPNAGKSTLVNQIVGSKVTIVSHKVQTTRAPVRGIAMHGTGSNRAQLIFIDTPGIFQPKRRLDRAMVDAAWGGVSDADVTALMVDSVRGYDEDVANIVERLKDQRGKKLLILNKVDLLEHKDKLLLLVKELTAAVQFERVFMISALDGSGVKDFTAYLAGAVPVGPFHYPEDEISDLPMRMLAAEITREKIFHRLHDELPYHITVETTEWKTLKGGAARIEQTIYVERDSQKKIVLGKDGATIKQISMESRLELAKLFDHPVHLFMFVKVRDNWGNDPERYREMGLNFPKA
jgi:GTPase